MPEQNQNARKVERHFALIYIDREGKICHETSPSISDSARAIMTSEFLKAVAESNEGGFPTPALKLPDSHSLISPSSSLAPTAPGAAKLGTDLQRGRRLWTEEHSFDVQTATISVKNKVVLRQYYEKVFQNLQQTNCRVIAKAYIKLVEPRKQIQYPYNGRKAMAGKTQQFSPEETKPPWWPLGVSHREPDHLPKAERIALLIHILCELRTSHGITAQKLKEAGQPIQQHISPIERLKLLDELYYVREKEENFLDAVTDGNERVLISRANLPQYMDVACRQNYPGKKRSQGEQKLKCELPSQNLSIRIRPAQRMISLKVPVDPYAVVNTSTQQHLLMQSGLKSSSSPESPRDLKRKLCVLRMAILPQSFLL
ncbi:hypothetical protein N7509_000022 [Penicillium cosmopolitanum]|uniref:Subtelomeric hrmA-associated cluster protein AFUB-079030/YDR124W-like helical bundle domain-containing protein n=1 Tax=Penicillium cosmopolitanum TaxID=1131564 RepID=A0A9W9WCI6_9EURO|nr:uncharacterized protein N7509_000022 [Penicillium cosmopolitanum]KAJ5414924.1 hypothetical protein N7509_000022 [Penicillium cosmopolitanum]